MQTYYMIPRARNFEGLLSAQLSGPFIDRVVKATWPKEMESPVSSLIYQRVLPNVEGPRAVAFKSTIHTYRLQHSAIESEHTPEDASGCGVSDTLDCLFENVQQAWESRFCSEICRLIENRVVATETDWYSHKGDTIFLDSAPRISLFGRKVNRVHHTSLASGFLSVLNPKYDRCPRQVLDFHPDTVHFLFLDLSKWAGEVKFKETPSLDYEESLVGEGQRRFFRVVMTVAARPVRPDLGTLYTILPAGWRGWLYKTVWKLLGVKP